MSHGWLHDISRYGHLFTCLDNYANSLDMGEIDAEGDILTH